VIKRTEGLSEPTNLDGGIKASALTVNELLAQLLDLGGGIAQQMPMLVGLDQYADLIVQPLNDVLHVSAYAR